MPPAAGWDGACAQAPAGLPAEASREGALALWAFSAGGSLAGAGRGGAGPRGEVLAGPCLGAEARLLLLQRSGGGGGGGSGSEAEAGTVAGAAGAAIGEQQRGWRPRAAAQGGPGWATERTAAPR